MTMQNGKDGEGGAERRGRAMLNGDDNNGTWKFAERSSRSRIGFRWRTGCLIVSPFAVHLIERREEFDRPRDFNGR